MLVDQGGKMTISLMARKLGVCRTTVESWIRIPEVQAIIEYRKDLANQQVKKALFKRATGFKKEQVKVFQYQGEPVIVPYEEYYPPETAAAKEWLTKQDEENWGDKNKMQALLDSDMPAINITLNFAGEQPKTIDVTPGKEKAK